ncbi:hypothetical protein [Dyella subtropica]|uniref:hypothetical protein n=1 Tax=Dyella subtropica TaxID=2992127 RepID=UPI00225527F1|nr:hypothetical protein [Dyella subtropica]
MSPTLQTLIETIEQDRSLSEPAQLRRRIDALDRLDAYLMDGPMQVHGASSTVLHVRAEQVRARLESINTELYASIRREIQQGTNGLLPWVRIDEACSKGDSYDYLDELVSGVLAFDPPDESIAELPDEMVFYQPTPARHIFDMIDRASLTEDDVLIDLGSGLGHVPLLTSICTGARSVGIELEAAYVTGARLCAQALHLGSVTFVQQDAREADLSIGTVFYLYTPFIGSVMRRVLDTLRREAAKREIRVCTFGPCTPIVAEEPWLRSIDAPTVDRTIVFTSGGHIP